MKGESHRLCCIVFLRQSKKPLLLAIDILHLCPYMGMPAFHNPSLPNHSSVGMPLKVCCRRPGQVLRNFGAPGWRGSMARKQPVCRLCPFPR
ncbi:hypothetical protein Ddc_01991 [Ditylenchus destructor]|nr:hypothetical protein Ddc_01991 [Ditylenchus destructor]